MSSNYAGTATYPATVPVTDDADPRNTTAVLAASAEALADRTAFLKGKGGAPANGGTISVPLIGLEQGVSYTGLTSGSGTGYTLDGVHIRFRLKDNAFRVPATFAVPRLSSGYIFSLNVVIAPDVGHGALPASMPTISLYGVDPLTGAILSTDSLTDSSGTVIAYETQHTLTVTPTLAAMSARQYYVYFGSEAGVDARTDLIIKAIYAIIQVE